MPPYRAKLKAQKILCAGTTASYFEKPEEFEFEAGSSAILLCSAWATRIWRATLVLFPSPARRTNEI
jgi:hypothetical protein